ncbi:hypothetical protein [Streptomyces fungicidicus]|uniref:hypothetical protein n=1 Tax=Streptomyces fungicidicus TaxID=68203 RepID=UPI00382F98D3
MTQPALSQQIRELEKRMGTSFRRYGGRPRYAAHSRSSIQPGGGNGFAATITG